MARAYFQLKLPKLNEPPSGGKGGGKQGEKKGMRKGLQKGGVCLIKEVSETFSFQLQFTRF